MQRTGPAVWVVSVERGVVPARPVIGPTLARMDTAMTNEPRSLGYATPAVSPRAQSLRLWLSVVGLVLSGLGWLWFAMCFTATYQAWWNSVWVFVAIFGFALA